MIRLRGILLIAVATFGLATLPAWERPWRSGARTAVATPTDTTRIARAHVDRDSRAPHVVWFILDGIRRQEAYSPTVDPFTRLRKRILRGEFYTFGDPSRNEEMRVSNAQALSLPGYQAMFSGVNPGEYCRGNDRDECPRQMNPTIFDALMEGGWKREEVVSIASWNGLDRAVSAHEDPTFTHHSAFATGIPDWAATLERSRNDPPLWNDSQRDVYTQEIAFDAWTRWHPRLLTVQWVDSDEWGHDAEFARYVDSIRAYDAWIDEWITISERLESEGKWGPTIFVVTTDHGRGERELGIFDRFEGHGVLNPSSYFHWAWIRIPPSLRSSYRAVPRPEMEQADLRPTVERLLGRPIPAGIAARSLVERQ